MEGRPVPPALANLQNTSLSQISTPDIPRKNNVLKDWERNAPLNPEHSEILVQLQNLVADRPIPAKFLDDETTNQDGREKTDRAIETLQQFFDWYSKIEETDVDEHKYSEKKEILVEYRTYCEKILGEIEGLFQLLSDLEEKYLLITKKTGELHNSCNLLVQEQDSLVRYAENLQNKLEYFNQLPKLTQQLMAPGLMVYDLGDILIKLDSCIEFISKNHEFRDSDVYLMKYRQLQMRALSLIKNEILNSMKTTTNSIIQQVKTLPENSANSQVENLKTQLETHFYLKFRTLAQKLKPLISQIETRANISEYLILLNDCQTCYFQQRRALLQASVQKTIQDLIAKMSDLSDLLRAGCRTMIDLCYNEYQLFLHFFSTESTGIILLLDDFGTILYSNIRPLYIRTNNIETLRQLISLLKSEVIDQQRGKSAELFAGVVMRMQEDIQERLLFLTQKYIEHEIIDFQPTPSDLDYPAKLQGVPEGETIKDDSELMPYKRINTSWYPTLERSLICASKLYTSIDTMIFENLATEIIQECTESLIRASKIISVKSPLDGKLFLIRHLLILREQIGAFEVNFLSTASALDFSHMRGAMHKILSVPRSLFALSHENPLLFVVMPMLEVKDVDPKKILERELKLALESLILAGTKTAIDPLLSFLTKVTAFKGSKTGEQVNLKAQSFASAESVSKMLDEVSVKMENDLPPLLEKICQYITNTSTQTIIYKPMRDQISESLKEIQDFIQELFQLENRVELMEKSERLYQLIERKLHENSQKTLASPLVMEPENAPMGIPMGIPEEMYQTSPNLDNNNPLTV